MHLESVHYYRTSSAFGSLAHVVTSQISAVFGRFRWAYQVEKGVLFFNVFDLTNILCEAGNSYYCVSINFLYSAMKYNSFLKSIYMYMYFKVY